MTLSEFIQKYKIDVRRSAWNDTQLHLTLGGEIVLAGHERERISAREFAYMERCKLQDLLYVLRGKLETMQTDLDKVTE
jgi:hypothetical protein